MANEQNTHEEMDEEAAPEPMPQPDPLVQPEPAGPVIVSEVDRLKAENLNLQLMNLMNRETILQQQVADIQNRQLPDLHRERQATNEKMAAMRAYLEQKYGVSLQTHHIRSDDGMVIPRNPETTEALQRLRREIRGA